MKENRASEEGKGENRDKSVVYPFIQSIKNFVNKLDPDGETKDKESSSEDSDKKCSDAPTVSSENPQHLENPDNSENTEKEYPKKPRFQSNSKTEEYAEVKPQNPVKSEDTSERSSELPLITLFHHAEEKVSHIFQSDRKQIIRMVGLILAALLIILGMVLLLGSADKVTDNVISGERAVISAFLIIVGLLIIAGIMASKIVGKTSFDDLFNEVQSLEGKKPSDDEKNKPEKEAASKTEPKIDSGKEKDGEDKDK